MTTTSNKAVVARFNHEFIVNNNMDTFHELVDPRFINHATRPGLPQGPESMIYFLQRILKPGFPDLQVEILDQLAEGDKVCTRKIFHGTHLGEFMGIAATGRKVSIQVIDIIRLENGKYMEHWGHSNIPDVLTTLSVP